MRKVLFLDRDGVLIREPEGDLQVDSLEKLVFMPGVFGALSSIRLHSDLLFIMVTNQDGLGTASFPEPAFQLPQQRMLETFAGEGIRFDAVHIDPSFPEDQSPNRKPGIGMLGEYLAEGYDMAGSLVIGDRISDIELAKNLGCKAIWFAEGDRRAELTTGRAAELGLAHVCILVSHDWAEIARTITGEGLPLSPRKSSVHRVTHETDITLSLDLDGSGNAQVSTGLRFFDHMLEQVAKHGQCDLSISVKGDLDVDEHHTMEDTAICLGQAFREALGDRIGISRYGFALPMDDCQAHVSIDFSGRPWLQWDVEFSRDQVGDVPTEMFYHFFKSFSDEARCNLAVTVTSGNAHHMAEAIFKAFARSVRGAVRRDPWRMVLPSTKGVLG